MPRLRMALFVLLLVPSCASVRPLDLDAAAIQAGALPTLAENEGILVVRVDTDLPITKLQMSQIAVLSDVPKGEHLRLLVLRAGRYRWSGLVVPAGKGDVRFQAEFDEFWEFRVEPRRTNYPGELSIRGRSGKTVVSLSPIIFRNRSAFMLRTLRERFPGLIERYPPMYTGQKSDGYLEYFGSTFVAPDPAVEGAKPR